jgi:hypothetical protein
MGLVYITQFRRPWGNTETLSTDRPEPIVEAARELRAAGFRIEVEVLSTGQIHMDVSPLPGHDPDDLGPLASCIEANDGDKEKLDEALDALVLRALDALRQRAVEGDVG